ncbi:MAG: sensor histidine kinase [Blastocatellia bacterium]
MSSQLISPVVGREDSTTMSEVERLRDEFIAVASHKMREPLHALQLALHAVVAGYAGEVNDQQMELLVDARRAANRLEEIMDDLLELAEIESGTRRIALQRMRPIDLARAAIERFQAAAESKHIKLESHVWPDLPWVMADPHAIQSVFDNLLSNAIRHTGRDGVIRIEANERADRVYFCVSDTGAGIPEEYLPTLFGRFVQVKGQPEGTGLGLALVKHFVEAQGGQISVESRVGVGTVFTFSLLEGGPASVRFRA